MHCRSGSSIFGSCTSTLTLVCGRHRHTHHLHARHVRTFIEVVADREYKRGVEFARPFRHRGGNKGLIAFPLPACVLSKFEYELEWRWDLCLIGF